MTTIRFDMLAAKQSLQEHVAGRIVDSFRKVKGQLEDKVRVLVGVALKTCPEYKSLEGGVLQAELGLVSRTVMVDPIIEFLKNNTKLDIFVHPGLMPSIHIIVFNGEYSQLLSLPTARYVSEPSGKPIPWLDWLLTKAANTVVIHHSIVYGNFPTSRSGMARMVYERAGFYNLLTSGKVPVTFIGTEDDNFILRALEPNLESITEMIFNEVAVNL